MFKYSNLTFRIFGMSSGDIFGTFFCINYPKKAGVLSGRWTVVLKIYTSPVKKNLWNQISTSVSRKNVWQFSVPQKLFKISQKKFFEENWLILFHNYFVWTFLEFPDPLWYGSSNISRWNSPKWWLESRVLKYLE